MWARLFLISVVAIIWSPAISTVPDKVVCYHGTWSHWNSGNKKFTVADIDTNLCTHINYAFVGINTDGTVRLNSDDPGFLTEYGKLKNRIPQPKLIIAIGGWNEGSVNFSIVVRDPNLRKKLLNSTLELIGRYNFDGFDFDWEYPTQRDGIPDDKKNFVTLLKEFRAEFVPRGYLLTAAVSATTSYYDMPGTAENLDFINLMTYDFAGSWSSVVAHHSSYPDSTYSANAWIKAGTPPAKLVLGIGTYGRSFTLRDPNNYTIGAPKISGGENSWSYNEICVKLLTGELVEDWINELSVPYARGGNQWVGYDNPKSIEIKAKFVVDNKLGGIMIWSAEQDDFRGLCGDRNPLLRAIQTGLNLKKGSEPELCTASEYVRDPEDCTKFYYCQPNGDSYTPLPFECPGGLNYDVKSGICNWPDQAPCP